MRVTVIDYKAGNLTSVLKALQYLGADVEVTDSDLSLIESAERIVLPGVGHFAATERLDATGMKGAIRVESCTRFPECNQKVPHVGWNSLETNSDSRLLAGVGAGEFVYFTHSYKAPLSKDTAAVTEYIEPFAAAVESDNVMGVQFHPEKSGQTGLKILRNFLEWTC
jgi:glutamine amidotransferase